MNSQEKLNPTNIHSLETIRKSNQRTRWRKEKNSGPPIFITKTYQILQNNVYKDVISWNEQGTNFIIIDVQKFQEQVLPIHFRQLNMYDFHKIRNDNNKNIFQHKEFRRDHKQFLRNIKRKGCTNKKNQQSQENMSISDHQQLLYDIEETPRSEEKYHKTIESIEKLSRESPIASIRIIHVPISPSPQKRLKMEEFINSLPQIIETEEQIHEKISELKKDPKYQCLTSKKDIRKLISRIRHKLPKRDTDEDLEELSIEEEIIVDNMIQNGQEIHQGVTGNPTLAILSTEKFLPKSINLIGSYNFCEDAQHLFFQKLY